MIVACLIKEIQVSTELRKMADIHLVPQQTIDDLIMKKFNAPLRRKPDDDDPVSENSNLEANAVGCPEWLPSCAVSRSRNLPNHCLIPLPAAAYPGRVRRDQGAAGDGAVGGRGKEEDRPRDRRVRPRAQGKRAAEPQGVHHRDQVEVRRRPGGEAG